MPCKNRPTKILALLATIIMLASFAIPVLAASANVEDALSRLASLQNAHIDPDWQPDVKANQSAVEGLLSAYKKCTTSERSTFTTQQIQDMQAYFTTLYKVQGKDPKDVSALFSEKESSSTSKSSSSKAASSSKSASSTSASKTAGISKAVSSSKAASSSKAISSSQSTSISKATSSSTAVSSSAAISSTGSSSSQISSVALVASSQPASTSHLAAPVTSDKNTGHSLSKATFPPQIPKNTGLFSFSGNQGLGVVLLLILFILTILVALRYLVALRGIGKTVKQTPADDLEDGFLSREQLRRHYGYENKTSDTFDSSDIISLPFSDEPAPQITSKKNKREEKTQLRREKKKPASPQLLEDFSIPEKTEHTSKTPQEKAQTTKSIQQAILDSPPPKPKTNMSAPSLPSHQEASPKTAPTASPDILTTNRRAGAPKPAPAPKNKRTGRPNKMTFIPGDPSELDGIDD